MPGFFARLFSKKSKLTKEQVLLSEVIKYCLSKNFFTTVTAFLQKGDLSSDDAKGDGTQTGQSFKIEHIVAHKAFTDEFEKNLEAFIVTKGSTVEDFAEICRAVRSANREAGVGNLSGRVLTDRYCRLSSPLLSSPLAAGH